MLKKNYIYWFHNIPSAYAARNNFSNDKLKITLKWYIQVENNKL